MATYDYPTKLLPQSMEFALNKTGVTHRNPLGGPGESRIFPGDFWRVSLVMPQWNARNPKAALAEAFFGRLAGGEHRVRVGHWLQPIPRGTLRGTPTLQALAPRGAQSIVLEGATGDLQAGDLIGLAGQLLRCFADCTPVGGVLTVPLVNRLHRQVNAGTAVQWDRPTVLMHMPATTLAAGFSPGRAVPIQVDLDEVLA